MGKGNNQWILIFLHHSAAGRTWLLGQSQACQRSGASGLWLLRISSYNPAVCREKANRRTHWELGTQHAETNSLLVCEKKHKNLSAPDQGFSLGQGQSSHCSFNTAGWRKENEVGERNMKVEEGIWRWRKEHEGLKWCPDFGERESFQILPPEMGVGY